MTDGAAHDDDAEALVVEFNHALPEEVYTEGLFWEYTNTGLVEAVAFADRVLWTSEDGDPVDDKDQPIPLRQHLKNRLFQLTTQLQLVHESIPEQP